jgi:hypothetical protein
MAKLSKLALRVYEAVPLEGTVHLSDIARITGMKYNVVSYYIAKLRELKMINSLPRAVTQAPMDLFRSVPPTKDTRTQLEHKMLYGQLLRD